MQSLVSATNFRTFALLLAVAACSGSAATGPQAELHDARSRWVAQAPASYSMVVNRLCECLPEMADRALITVRNGVVESRRYVANGNDVPPEYASGYPTVPEMFAMIEEAMRNDVRPIEVQYAPAGYPTRISIGDPAVDAPVILVSEFHAL